MFIPNQPTDTAPQHPVAAALLPMPCVPGGAESCGREQRIPAYDSSPAGAPLPTPAEVVSASWSFPAEALHARMARHWMAGLLETLWNDEDASGRAIQVFGEVIANAVEHGCGPVTVTATVQTGVLLCEVGDASPELPAATTATDDDEHHRGLAMIHAILGHAPYVRCTHTGKIVGFIVTARDSTDGTDGADAANSADGAHVG